jgi:hypothetical protein
MAAAHALHLKRRSRNALVWVGFSAAGVSLAKKRRDDVTLELCVPRDEILISQYANGMSSWESVLWNMACHGPDCGPCLCSANQLSIRRTWQRLLMLSGTDADWQGVLDRIEPSWYRGRVPDPPEDAVADAAK